jgi:hypothetical protein
LAAALEVAASPQMATAIAAMKRPGKMRTVRS